MCQAYEAEFNFVHSIECKYGTYKAFMAGLPALPDYCYEHSNYWCGCLPEQRNDKVRFVRRRRHQEYP